MKKRFYYHVCHCLFIILCGWFGAANAADNKLSHSVGWAVSGSHECRSPNERGHVCPVNAIRQSSCDAGHERLAEQDCCAKTRKCRFVDGKKQCRYGGVSIAYQPGTCSPQL